MLQLIFLNIMFSNIHFGNQVLQYTNEIIRMREKLNADCIIFKRSVLSYLNV